MHPEGGTGPIDHRGMPTKVVLQQKSRCTVNLKSGDLVLVKADAWKGKRKIKDRWDEETWKVPQQITADVSSYKVTNQHGWS